MSSAFEGMAKQLQQLGPIGGGRWLYGWTKAQNAVELTLTRGGRTYLNLSLDDVADWTVEQCAKEWRDEALCVMSGEKVVPENGYHNGFAPPLANDPEEDYRAVPDATDFTAAMEMLGSVLIPEQKREEQ